MQGKTRKTLLRIAIHSFNQSLHTSSRLKRRILHGMNSMPRQEEELSYRVTRSTKIINELNSIITCAYNQIKLGSLRHALQFGTYSFTGINPTGRVGQ